MPRLTPGEFQQVADVAYQLIKRRDQRPGQAWFNALYDVFPNTANQIRGDKNRDPFYNDNNLAAFFEYLIG